MLEVFFHVNPVVSGDQNWKEGRIPSSTSQSKKGTQVDKSKKGKRKQSKFKLFIAGVSKMVKNSTLP